MLHPETLYGLPSCSRAVLRPVARILHHTASLSGAFLRSTPLALPIPLLALPPTAITQSSEIFRSINDDLALVTVLMFPASINLRSVVLRGIRMAAGMSRDVDHTHEGEVVSGLRNWLSDIVRVSMCGRPLRATDSGRIPSSLVWLPAPNWT